MATRAGRAKPAHQERLASRVTSNRKDILSSSSQVAPLCKRATIPEGEQTSLQQQSATQYFESPRRLRLVKSKRERSTASVYLPHTEGTGLEQFQLTWVFQSKIFLSGGPGITTPELTRPYLTVHSHPYASYCGIRTLLPGSC